MQETQSAFLVAQQQHGHVSSLNTQLQTELQQLKEELQRIEGVLSDTLAEKVALDGQVRSCLEELESVKAELRTVTQQRDQAEQVSHINFQDYVHAFLSQEYLNFCAFSAIVTRKRCTYVHNCI